MRIAICDDSQEMLEELCFFLRQIDQTADADIMIFNKSFDLIDEIEQGRGFDLYILDIYIDAVLGTEIAAIIRKHDKHAYIIFATSAVEFALQSYDYMALHYLIKPIKYEDLRSAVMRMEPIDDDYINTSNDDGDILRTRIRNIIYIENCKNRQIVVTKDAKTYCTSTMRDLECRLSSDKRFYRLSSGVIINLERVVRITLKEVELEGGAIHNIPRGRYKILKSLCEK